MIWKNITLIALQVLMGFTVCAEVLPRPKSRIMDLLTDITRTSKNVIMGTVGKVRDILPETDLMYPDDHVIYELFEYLKVKMRDPYPALEVPVLDPFLADELTGDIVNDILGNITIELQGVNISKVSEFILHDVKMNWKHRELYLNVTLPVVHGSAVSYSVSGLLGHMIPIYGNGPLRLSVSNLSAVLNIYLGARNDTYLYIKSVTADYTVEEINVRMKNLMGGGRFGELLNRVLSEDGPRILDLVKPDVIDFSENWLRDGGNILLANTNMTIRSLIDFLRIFSTNKMKSILHMNLFKSEL